MQQQRSLFKPVGSSHKQQDAHLWLIAKNWNSSKLLVEKHVVTVKWEANGDQIWKDSTF